MEVPMAVIDNGSGNCRVGFAGSDQPTSFMRTVAVIPVLQGRKQDNLCLVNNFSTRQDFEIEMRNPISHGIITDWEAMEILWNHIFMCKLKVFPEDQPVLITDSPASPITNREKIAEVLFEGFDIPALLIANTALLSLSSYGLITGLVIEAGHGLSYTAVVCEGEALRQAVHRLDIAGMSLTKHLRKLLLKANILPMNLEKKIVTDIKKTCCHVSLDFKKDSNSNKKSLVNFELPDGQQLTLNKERFTCPEPLFKPQMLGNDSPGLHLLARSSLQKVPAEYRDEVVGHVVFAGGSSMFPGFSERIRQELVKISPEDYQYKFLASPERDTAAWVGGSIIASLSSSKLMLMTMEDFNEYGASHVYKKFI